MSRPEERRAARVWTHEDVECRLREAITTLRRLPMPRNGIPREGRGWPEYVHTMADKAHWIVGADTPEHFKRNEAERNRTKLPPLPSQIRDMDEVLKWFMLIRDGRKRKVVFARSHVWPDSERPIYSYRQIARGMHTSHENVRQLYRKGIRDIATALSNQRNI